MRGSDIRKNKSAAISATLCFDFFFGGCGGGDMVTSVVGGWGGDVLFKIVSVICASSAC